MVNPVTECTTEKLKKKCSLHFSTYDNGVQIQRDNQKVAMKSE
jgi:hypothetical protein